MQFDSRTPRRLAPRELLLGRTPGVLSLWQRSRHDPEAGTASARDLVAIWAGLCRLAEGPSVESLTSLERVVADDAVALRAAVTSLGFQAAQWRQRVEELDRAWDAAEQAEEGLDWQTYTLFEELDRASLACWWLRKQTEEATDAVERLYREIEAAEAYHAEKVNLFLCLATDAAAILSDSRRDLDRTEPCLWDTLLKHRRIEDARDQIELSPRRTDMIRPIELLKQRRTGMLPEAVFSSFAGDSIGTAGRPNRAPDVLQKLIRNGEMPAVSEVLPAPLAPVFGSLLAEHAARETQYATAAARPEETLTPARAALAGRTFSIKEDEVVQVKLDLRLVQPAKIWVRLGGPARQGAAVFAV